VIEGAAAVPEVDDMRARFGDGIAQLLEVCRIGRAEMAGQGVDVVDAEAFYRHSRGISGIHTGRAAVANVVTGGLDVGAERTRRHRQAVARFGRKVDVRLDGA